MRVQQSIEQELSIVGQIYAAAVNPQRWEGCLQNLAERFSSRTAQIGLRSDSGGDIQFLHVAGPVEESLFPRFLELIAEDPLESVYHPLANGAYTPMCDQSRLDAARNGGAWHCREMFSDDVIHNSAMYREVRQPMDMEYCMSKRFWPQPGYEAVIALGRPAAHEPYTADDCGLLDRFGEHFERAVSIYLKLCSLDRERRSALQVLDAINIGVALVNQRGGILHANVEAQRIFDSCDGLVVKNSRIRCAEPEADRALTRFIASAEARAPGVSNSQASSLRVERISSEFPYSLLISEVTGELFSVSFNGLQNRVIMILITDPLRTPHISAEAIASLLNITPAQARVVSLLCQGQAVDQIAAVLKVTPGTVRAHFKAVFRATGTRSQTDLVRRVILSVPSFGNGGQAV